MGIDRFTIQWHLTDVCNFRCKHCYQNTFDDNGANIETLLLYYQNLERFASNLKKRSENFKAHINFTGGEPFLKKEFLDLLKVVSQKDVFSFGILSNGFIPNKNELIILKSLKPSFIQISIEGDRKINDEIRGEGTFDQIVKSFKVYNRLGVPVIASFTANTHNYTSFADVVKIASKNKVSKLWTDRYLPQNSNDDLALSTIQVKEFFKILHDEKKKRRFFSKLNISTNRALQFLESGGRPYSCNAGKSLLALLPNGDVLPCRRLPLVIGNLNTEELVDIYQDHQTLNDLRNLENIDCNCQNCFYFESCRGGLKCLSYAITGNFHAKDPNCWL